MRFNLTGYTALIGALSFAACGDDNGRDYDKGAAETNDFEAQAERGQALFAQHCAECHGSAGQGTDQAPRLVGLDKGALPEKPPASRMVRDVDFVTVADVAGFAVANMPPGMGGSLSNDEYLAILAFDLKANGINLDEELTLDLAATLKIPR